MVVQFFMANCAQRRGYYWYVDGYIGLVQNREKKMSRRTIGVNLVAALLLKDLLLLTSKILHTSGEN